MSTVHKYIPSMHLSKYTTFTLKTWPVKLEHKKVHFTVDVKGRKHNSHLEKSCSNFRMSIVRNYRYCPQRILRIDYGYCSQKIDLLKITGLICLFSLQKSTCGLRIKTMSNWILLLYMYRLSSENQIHWGFPLTPKLVRMGLGGISLRYSVVSNCK